jgi:hypothetical protein
VSTSGCVQPHKIGSHWTVDGRSGIGALLTLPFFCFQGRQSREVASVGVWRNACRIWCCDPGAWWQSVPAMPRWQDSPDPRGPGLPQGRPIKVGPRQGRTRHRRRQRESLRTYSEIAFHIDVRQPSRRTPRGGIVLSRRSPAAGAGRGSRPPTT